MNAYLKELKEITLKKKNYFCTWNGGHDSGLSLYYALKNNQILCLIASLQDFGNQLKANFFAPAILRAQADQLNIPLLIFNANSETFSDSFTHTLNSIKKHAIIGGYFPLINHSEQKDQFTQLCQKNELEALFPLWQKDKEALLSEFIEMGFKAKIIAVNERFLTRDFLTKDLDKEVIHELRNRKVDLFGENGEFQTILYAAPFFKTPLHFKEGDINLKNGYWVVDLNLIPTPDTNGK